MPDPQIQVPSRLDFLGRRGVATINKWLALPLPLTKIDMFAKGYIHMYIYAAKTHNALEQIYPKVPTSSQKQLTRYY